MAMAKVWLRRGIAALLLSSASWIGIAASGNPAHAASASTSAVFSNVTWTTGATIPHPHVEGAVVASKSSVYAVSGATSDCTDGVGGASTTDVDIYHPATNTFSVGAPIPNPRQGTPSAIVIGKKIYVVSGASTCHGPTVPAVDVYTTTTNSWATLPPSADLPSSLQGEYLSCGVAVGKSIYLFKGTSIGVLNTASPSPAWTVLSEPNLVITDFCSAVTLGKTIVLVSPGNGQANFYSQRIFEFDPASSKLTELTTTTTFFAEESVGLIKKEIVMAGGDYNSGTAVQIVTPSKNQVTTASSLPDGRDDAEGGSVVSGKMYIVGGHSPSEGTTPKVLIGTPT